MPAAEYAAWSRRLRRDAAASLLFDWTWWRRGDQCPPEGDWHVWLLLAGRGFGKTRTGAEWVRSYAEAHPGARIALVAASLHEARQVMVEGESGLLAIAPDEVQPEYESSLRRVSWANGAIATLYSAAEPDSLRGPEHSAAWCDEVAKWPQGEAAWDNLMLTMRIGENPRVVATTTPRGVPLVRRLIREKGVATTAGRTQANSDNLSPRWLATMGSIYGGTRLGRQELDGEMLEDVEGALWTRALIERCRVETDAIGKPARVIIGVDPPASANGDARGGGACERRQGAARGTGRARLRTRAGGACGGVCCAGGSTLRPAGGRRLCEAGALARSGGCVRVGAGGAARWGAERAGAGGAADVIVHRFRWVHKKRDPGSSPG
jgi:phage terminase large subunit-like protein